MSELTETGRQRAITSLHRKQSGKFALLLLLLMALLLMSGLGEGSRVLSLLVWAGVLVAAVNAVSERRRTMWIAIALAVPPFVLNGLSLGYNGSSGILLGVVGSAAVLFLFAFVAILLFVARQTRIRLDTIFGALCAYMLLGWVFAFAFAITDVLYDSAALNLPAPPDGSHAADVAGARFPNYVYFSFTTLTTLGYGDVTPKATIARNLAVLEAIIGQIYIAVLVGRLVGLAARPGAEDEAVERD